MIDSNKLKNKEINKMKVYEIRHMDKNGDIWRNSYQAKNKNHAIQLSKNDGNKNIVSVELLSPIN